MKPLEIVYFSRLAVGIVAALICIGYVLAVYGAPNPNLGFSIFLNSMSLAIIVYILSYYVLKRVFKDQVTKTQKIFTTGIGVYFLAWIVFYALTYSVLYRLA